METTQNQQTTQKQQKTETETYIVVDFLDLDPSKFSFTAMKINKYQGKSVGIRYDNRILYVKYGDKTRKFNCPFGINISADLKENPEYAGGKRITGYTIAVSLPKDYTNDAYFLKAKELDEFFIEACLANAFKWGLGGTPDEAPDRKSVAGYDKWGYKGKWKRLLKPSYKTDKATNLRTYQEEYAPRLEFGVKSTVSETMNSENKKVVTGAFTTHFFDKTGVALANCCSDNMQNLVPKMSSVTVVAHWQGIALGEFGASLKPKAEQIMVFPSERLTGECLLSGGGEDDDDEGSGLLSENMMGDLTVTKVTPTNKPPPLRAALQKPVQQQQQETTQYEEGDEFGETIDDSELQYVNTPAPAPAPAAKLVRRVVPAKKS